MTRLGQVRNNSLGWKKLAMKLGRDLLRLFYNLCITQPPTPDCSSVGRSVQDSAVARNADLFLVNGVCKRQHSNEFRAEEFDRL